MARKRKKKTAVMTLRVDPQVKVAAERAAELDHRSVANFVEVLILNHCKTVGISPAKTTPKETHQ